MDNYDTVVKWLFYGTILICGDICSNLSEWNFEDPTNIYSKSVVTTNIKRDTFSLSPVLFFVLTNVWQVSFNSRMYWCLNVHIWSYIRACIYILNVHIWSYIRAYIYIYIYIILMLPSKRIGLNTKLRTQRFVYCILLPHILTSVLEGMIKNKRVGKSRIVQPGDNLTWSICNWRTHQSLGLIDRNQLIQAFSDLILRIKYQLMTSHLAL